MDAVTPFDWDPTRFWSALVLAGLFITLAAGTFKESRRLWSRADRGSVVVACNCWIPYDPTDPRCMVYDQDADQDDEVVESINASDFVQVNGKIVEISSWRRSADGIRAYVRDKGRQYEAFRAGVDVGTAMGSTQVRRGL